MSRVIIIIIAILLIGAAGWMVFPYGKAATAYPGFKARAENINLPGNLLASAAKDTGCRIYKSKGDTKESICKLLSYKIYKSQGALEQEVLQADDQLVGFGFPVSINASHHRSGYTTASDYVIDPKTQKETYMTFTNLTAQTSHLRYYDLYQNKNQYAMVFAGNEFTKIYQEVTQQLKLDEDLDFNTLFNNLSEGEYVYGVLIVDVYSSRWVL